jgi:hypothetical protein
MAVPHTSKPTTIREEPPLIKALTGPNAVALKWPFREDSWGALTVYEDDPNINASRCAFHRQESGDTISVAHILLESDCLVCRFLSAIINSFDIDQTAAVVAAFEPWKWQDKPDGKWYFRLHIHDITNLELSPTLGLELFLNRDGDLGSGDWAHEAGTLPEISGDTGLSRALT